MSQPIRIGEILVKHGVLTEQQVFEIVRAQKTQCKPFGVLAEQMFDVTVESIENAWIEQYHLFTGTINLNDCKIDESVLRLINRRQAWQFEILPIAYEPTGELLIAAAESRLARAVTFATHKLDQPAFFRVAESKQLREFLTRYYPMPEVTHDLIERAREFAA